MSIKQAPIFNIKDFTLDVRLKAISSDGVARDFTGKNTFSVEFFRKSIGFGITDVEIEVNTSLQPIITITFKDLYGNTVFGKSLNKDPDLSNDNSAPDFSMLFNWPPPKFLFTFKGFLGKSASWMLSMKKTSVSYDSSDGSYNIKCEFVPNQWGFFSDLPFLYLLAVKSLKKKDGMSDEDLQKVQTIFDLIKIGKQVEVKTVETTKEFDGLLNQMATLKSGRAYDSIYKSKIISYGNEITGSVAGKTIFPFNNITIIKPAENDSIIGGDKIKDYVSVSNAIANNLINVNNYLLLTAKIGKAEPTKGVTFSDYSDNKEKYSSDISAKISLISQNIDNIDLAIKKSVYNSSKSMLEKITIGEVFRQIAEDSGYIMGKILEAGYQGYTQNVSSRDSSQNKPILIGRNFPLVITKDGEEKPATKENLIGSSVGVEEYELKFVNDFISAISEGIATELLSDQQSAEVIGDNLIKKRINNLEALSPNPYKSNYNSIVENIMIRSGIAGYLTRSSDPNRPGTYDKTLASFRNGATTVEDIVPLVNADFENITAEIIGGLSDSDHLKLKKFCSFWENFLSEDCEYINEPGATKTMVRGRPVSEVVSDPNNPFGKFQLGFNTNILGKGVNDSLTILDYPVPTEIPAPFGGVLKKINNVTTLKEIIQDIFRPKNTKTTGVTGITGIIETTDSTNANFIDFEKLQAIKVINNGITYHKSYWSNKKNEYTYVMFDSNYAGKLQQLTSADSDAEIKNDVEKQKTEEKPLGFVNLQSPYTKDSVFTSSPVLLPVVKNINENLINQDTLMLLDYSKITTSSISSLFYKDKSSLVDTKISTYNNYIKNKLGEPDNPVANEIPTKNITFAVAHSPYYNRINGVNVNGEIEGGTKLIFGPFVGGNAESDSLVQRGYIRTMCVKLKGRIGEADDKKNQIISNVLGKSGEQKDALYKQMHVLYQQWEVLILKDSDNLGCNVSMSSPVEATIGQIANSIANRYKGDGHHINLGVTQKVSNPPIFVNPKNISKDASENTFIYSYPLNFLSNETEPINVKNSIISIETLYKPNGNTTVLTAIQQICTKNNFMFIPMPGDSGAFSIDEIYKTHYVDAPIMKNFFYVQFLPTPESRATLRNNDNAMISSKSFKDNISLDALEIKFGSPDNQVVKNITVDTSESKATAESIVNLQRLVDPENKNKKVTTDCSMLPVMEGRSYKATAEMLGNAQVFPMQFFYLDSNPLFNGLYQIMKVKHSIKPNDMTTSAEGIRMRMDFQTGKFGGIPPITLETLANLPVTLVNNGDKTLMSFGDDDFNPNIYKGIEATGGNKGDLLLKNIVLTSKKPVLNQTQKNNINSLIKQMNQNGITNQFAQAAILSVIYKESSFIPKNENLNYSQERILQVWPGTSVQIAKDSANNPEKLGNIMYGGKYLNGPTEGYLYRGRGYNQITFKSAYKQYSDLTGIDLVKDPDKLNNPIYAGIVACAFFKNGFLAISHNQDLAGFYKITGAINDFTSIDNALGAMYHINAGVGQSISVILADSTGGRQKAFQVSVFFLGVAQDGKIV